MVIQVIYKSDKRFGAVHPSRLESLIRSGKLFAFRRAQEWVILEKDPVRGHGGSYSGSERRNEFTVCVDSFLTGFDEDGNSSSVNSKQVLVESESMKILESYLKK
jgi:hypothetical protein